ncbi:molecular chaperone [Escherichia coli]|uniref:fimbrial biogenesis chaperone n=1 Tax=Escherichia coli TaxID=562 RepID=UPI000BB8A0AF|nr:molecular chaperone [Escherichia coli]EFN9101076.1 molecular chaperone [Escherichia coli]EIY1065378.1 molecular chaperone [Escherichia coli]EKR7626466.1 molecular chaperone [Escherichia coli]ELD1760652.1 molecular chaperone [Escherichia coli]ELD1782859.1 molecular chaperone [Escherichia coli]
MYRKIVISISLNLLFISSMVSAGVEIGGTRLVYREENNQASISLNNPDDKPFLIQSWVSQDENDDEKDNVFITTPPLFKLKPHTQNSIRVMLSDNKLPSDRESVYWLNIKTIPSSSPGATNELVIAIKSKIKLFYRPSGLKGEPSLAYQQLVFSNDGGVLHVHNPSPYSVTLNELRINGIKIEKPPMVLPFTTVPLPQAKNSRGNITWTAINDFGGVSSQYSFKL